MSKLDHTLTTYKSGSVNNVSITITGCQVGQPIFVVHRTDKGDSGSTVIDYPLWTYIRCTSGSEDARSVAYHHYAIGTFHANSTYTAGDRPGGANCFIVIAKATSVVFNITASAGQTILFYK